MGRQWRLTESIGVYWILTYELLEARGFAVYLVNARHDSNLDGKKTDLLDCQSPKGGEVLWIQQLHTYDLLRASFRPEADMVSLRTYICQRDNLIRDRASQIQPTQKALT